MNVCGLSSSSKPLYMFIYTMNMALWEAIVGHLTLSKSSHRISLNIHRKSLKFQSTLCEGCPRLPNLWNSTGLDWLLPPYFWEGWIITASTVASFPWLSSVRHSPCHSSLCSSSVPPNDNVKILSVSDCASNDPLPCGLMDGNLTLHPYRSPTSSLPKQWKL